MGNDDAETLDNEGPRRQSQRKSRSLSSGLYRRLRSHTGSADPCGL